MLKKIQMIGLLHKKALLSTIISAPLISKKSSANEKKYD